MQARIHIGTSGWHYPHWQGRFYPPELPDREQLIFYARHFHTVELNNTFYRLPRDQTFRNWRERTPPGFIFAVKASRFITHIKRLHEAIEPVQRLLAGAALLQEKLGPILFQLPPHWRFDGKRLQDFLAVLPSGPRYAFEFRDPSWINPQALELLRAHNAAFCIYDYAGFFSPWEITADFVYLRLHGPAGAYRGSYPPETLASWARSFRRWAAAGLEVFCYFDNDEFAFAALNALDLQRLVKEIMVAG